MFDVTNEEKNTVLDLYFDVTDGLVLRQFPKRQKRKYICLLWIIELFETTKPYSEQEVNAILHAVYPDYVMIRRYLVDYKFLLRERDGSRYWRP